MALLRSLSPMADLRALRDGVSSSRAFRTMLEPMFAIRD